jgi:hypothetical protein
VRTTRPGPALATELERLHKLRKDRKITTGQLNVAAAAAAELHGVPADNATVIYDDGAFAGEREVGAAGPTSQPEELWY